MLMKTENMPIEKVSVEYSHCQDLLDYIDGPFQERIEAGQIDWTITQNACGTKGCLVGWFAVDNKIERLIVNDGAMFFGDGYNTEETNKYFGVENRTRDKIFGMQSNGISSRRAALVEHMASL